jgi:hypothetical protein
LDAPGLKIQEKIEMKEYIAKRVDEQIASLGDENHATSII